MREIWSRLDQDLPGETRTQLLEHHLTLQKRLNRLACEIVAVGGLLRES